MKLQDRVAIITGAGSGIGQATAELFAREGAAVIVADNREKRANATVDRISEAGGRAAASVVDVTSTADVQRMVNDALQTYGRLDILYNNAGTIRPGKAPDLDEADWDIVLNTNVKAIFLGAKYAIPQMRDGGAIVNTASISGITADPASIAYGASKAAVINLTRCLAVDHAGDGIRVNCICPGVIATPPVLRWIFVDEADRQRIAKMHPLGRMGQPEDIANAALFLASDDASFITGEALVVDGGFTVDSRMPLGGGPPQGALPSG